MSHDRHSSRVPAPGVPSAPLSRWAFWRHRLAAVAVAGLAVLALPGCGCCDDDGEDLGGTLEVLDDDPVMGVQTVHVSVPGGPIEPFDVFLAPGESAFIDLFPDFYNVDIIWEDQLFDPCCSVDIFDDELTTVPVVYPVP